MAQKPLACSSPSGPSLAQPAHRRDVVAVAETALLAAAPQSFHGNGVLHTTPVSLGVLGGRTKTSGRAADSAALTALIRQGLPQDHRAPCGTHGEILDTASIVSPISNMWGSIANTRQHIQLIPPMAVLRYTWSLEPLASANQERRPPLLGRDPLGSTVT
ncbi:hypothetical protein T440DRAFT_175089 [Plenodomus tracheiphilus IPT5]|uniref:Uncharacterized protein n=1 Tax=Plenodomus tracheiphilus IPT5 TaxID=1408161 RepID=A0A6A7B1Q2_9PLEO|nr:hypothetical protein T440DRAFT_175089 [Plenodomus tracheiphilus IPT5]